VLRVSTYPIAKIIKGNSAGAFVTGYPPRGLLHTTEGSSAAGAFGAYRSNNSWPHFTVDRAGLVYQHLSVDVAARSLENPPGGVETNRAHCIQIEIVGYAAQPTQHPAEQMAALAALMRWVEATCGVPPVGAVFHGGGSAAVAPYRFTADQWRRWSGWCGHQHCPEQTHGHWDPGLIDIAALFPATPAPEPAPPVPSKEIEGVKITAGSIQVQALDDAGRGWVPIPHPIDRLMFVCAQGSAPARDGYWPPVTCDVNDSGPETIVTLAGAPHQGTVVYWKALIEE
jgi:hypothetical protein